MRFKLEDFWESADGDNWTPAFMRAQLTVPQSTTLEIEVSPRLYRCDQRIDVIRGNLSIVGIKRNKRVQTSLETTLAGMPTLYFPTAGNKGLDIGYPGRYLGGTYGSLVVGADAAARGDGFFLSGLALVSTGPHSGSRSDHGIIVHAPCILEHFVIRGFRGDGLLIDASAALLGNANSSVIRYGAIYDCGGYGSRVAGGDVNQIRIEQVSYTGCGVDLRGCGGDYTVVVGQEVDFVTINDALPNTLYRLVVGGTNCDYTTPGSGVTLASVAAGVSAAVSAAVSNQDAAQVAEERLAIWSNNATNFTCTTTGSVGSMTVVQETVTSTSAQEAFCFGGATNNGLRLNDDASCLIQGGSYHGWVFGDVTEQDAAYGYARVSTSGDIHGMHEAVAASLTMSGSTASLVLSDYRSGPNAMLVGRSIQVIGADNPANNGSFTITQCLAGVYGAASLRLRVTSANASETTWLVINGVTVPVTFTSGDTTLALCRDRIIAAITAAAISGVSAALYDTDELTITGTDVIVQYGPFLTEIGGTTARTLIQWTNASGVTESTFTGQFSINARVGTRGVYSGFVFGRPAQVLDLPLIGAHYVQCLINGPDDGDAYVSKGGYSVFDDCYTEGYPNSIMLGPAEVRGGQMSVQAPGRVCRIGRDNDFSPSVAGGLWPEGKHGTVRGRLGDSAYGRAALGWDEYHPSYGDVWRLIKAFTAGGVGQWEMCLNPAGTTQVPMRFGALDNLRIGAGGLAIGGAGGVFVNFADGTLPAPGSRVGNGANGITETADGNDTGATGYLEWRNNGIYRCRVDVFGVYRVTSASGASHASIGIGTHNLPAGMQGRAILRNIQGVTIPGPGDHQWTRNTASALFLEDFNGTFRTLSGTWTQGSGLLILCRLVAYGFVSGSVLSLSSGNWVIGDRFVNASMASGDATEWVCTASGVTTSATWAPVAVLP